MIVKLFATSDIHGYILSHDELTGTPTTYGLAKIASYIQKARQCYPVILLDGGDFLQGSRFSSYLYATDQMDSLTHLLDKLQYDAFIPGNHDLVWGIDYLRSLLESVHTHTLSSNLKMPNHAPAFSPSVIIERGGIRFGIIGAVTQYINRWLPNAVMQGHYADDPALCVQEELQKIKGKADVVVVVHHGGLERDLESGQMNQYPTGENESWYMLSRLTGVDIFIAAHQHAKLSGKIQDTVVMENSSKGACLSEITLDVQQKNGTVQVHVIDARHIDMDTMCEDEEIRRLISPQYEAFDCWMQKPLEKTKTMQYMHAFLQDACQTPYSAFFYDGCNENEPLTLNRIARVVMEPCQLAVYRMTGKAFKQVMRQFPAACFDGFDSSSDELRGADGHPIVDQEILLISSIHDPNNRFLPVYRLIGENMVDILEGFMYHLHHKDYWYKQQAYTWGKVKAYHGYNHSV